MKSIKLRFLTVFLFTFLSLFYSGFSSILQLKNTAKLNIFNALNVLQPDSCATINSKFLFTYRSKTNKNPNYPLNKFDYKFVQLTKTDLIIYRAKSQDPTVFINLYLE
jgi:hypothetical protein